MLTEPDIRDALRACYTSYLSRPVNIMDLGLLESIVLTPDPEAPGAGIPGVPQKSRLALTILDNTADQDARTQLSAQIANRLAGLAELSRTTIHFAETPTWTPARITAQGRVLLQLDAARFPILNNR